MWLIGGLVGLVVGAAVGHFGGAFAGAVIGVLAGLWLWTIVKALISEQLAETEAKIRHIYESLGDIHFRLKALEDAKKVAASAPASVVASEPATRTAAPPVAAPVRAAPEPPQAAPEKLPDLPIDIPVLAPAPVAASAPPAEAPLLELPPLAPAASARAVSAETSAAGAVAQSIAAPAAAPALAVEAVPALHVALPAAQPPARKAAPPRIEQPEEPGLFARLFAGNLVAKAGVVILFFGVGFLLKYAYDHSILPPWTRLFGVAVAACGLFYAGRRLLESRRLYALILMGGGFGFLYLDVYFALKWYQYVSAPVGFALFMALGVAMVLSAVRMDARVLAVLGLLGAFLAPPLASTGGGNYVLLFSYYTLLNLFILTVSWFKAWRELNLVGFFFTFVISSLWGAQKYTPALFSSVEPFVVIFFVIYLAIPILFATRQPPELKGFVDGTLVFGTPVAAAFMQARVVAGMGDHALAWSAGVAGVLYAILGLATRRREHMGLLGETYIALSTVFLTMTVFFALDAYPTFALWTLEGAAIVWVGLRQERALARAFGLLLQLGAALYFLGHYNQIARANPLFNDFIFGCALIAAAAWITAWLMDRRRDILTEAETLLGNLFLLWGWVWWFGGAAHALYHRLETDDFVPSLLIFATACLTVAELAGTRLGENGWPALRRVAALHLGFMIAALFGAIPLEHPLAHLGGIAWPLAFVAHFWILLRHEGDALDAWVALRYAAGWTLLAIVSTWEVVWLIDHAYYAAALGWAVAGFFAGWLRHTLREADIEGAPRLSWAVLAWGLLVWIAAGWGWLDQTWGGITLSFAMLTAAALSAALFELAGTLARWPDLRRTASLLVPAMLLAAVMLYAQHAEPFEDQGLWAWPLAFVMTWLALRRHERAGIALGAPVQHLLVFWLLALLLVWEADMRLAAADAALQWQRAAWGAIPALLVLVVTRLAERDFWPFNLRAGLYRDAALWPLLAVLVLWSLVANVMAPGEPVPAMHLPLINPLDLTQLLAFYVAWLWVRGSAPEYGLAALAKPASLALAFLWINGVALRAIHYYAGVPYEIHALLASVLTQSALSILWTSCALVLMTWASRRGVRGAWSVGAGLLAVVVAKLALNDLGNSGTVARIVSFLVVGVLLLLIGYFAPLPPGQAAREGDGRG